MDDGDGRWTMDDGRWTMVMAKKANVNVNVYVNVIANVMMNVD